MRLDREVPVWERILRRDMEPEPHYEIRGDHPSDPSYLLVRFADGSEAACPKDHIWMLPKMAAIHEDARRKIRALDLQDLAE